MVPHEPAGLPGPGGPQDLMVPLDLLVPLDLVVPGT